MVALATCSYSEFDPSMGVPVRTSNGAPRWKLRYNLTVAWKAVMPDPWTIRWTDPDKFDLTYRRKLESVGIETLHEDTLHMAEQAGADTLVLLCFERLSKPGNFCHRTSFAAWWLEQTGEAIRELGATGPTEQTEPLW